MSQISVISKLTGVETTTEGTQVTLSHSSIVELHVERADVSHFARSGNDLVVTLHSGEVITLKNFYVTDAQGVSQLVLQDSDGALWWIEDPAGAATYESIASTDVLLAASGSDTGGAAIWPWALGGIVAAGGIAAAASSGGGGGGGVTMTITVTLILILIPARQVNLLPRIQRRRMHPRVLRSRRTGKPSPVPLNPAAQSR